MSDLVSTARSARENLRQGLAALQAPGVPAAVTQAAEPVAQAMGALHQIEASGGAGLAQHAPVALEAVRRALGMLQGQPATVPAVAQALEAVASSLSLVHQLSQGLAATQRQQPSPVAPAPQYQAPAVGYGATQAQPPVPQAPMAQPQQHFAPAQPAAAYPQQAPQGFPAPQQPAYAQPQQQAYPPQQQAYPPQQQAYPPQQQAYPPQQPAYAQPQQQAYPPQQPQQPAYAQPQQPAYAPQAAHPPVAAEPPPAQQWPQKVSTRPAAGGAGLTVEAELGAHSATNFYKGLSGNDVIDSGGIFIATYQIPELGQPLTIKVSLPGGYEFEAAGVVRWTREAPHSTRGVESPPGFGAQFTNISQEGRQLVYRYVRNREPLFHDDL